MQYFSDYEWLGISIANHYGLDKKTFKERVQWFRENHRNLEPLIETCDPDSAPLFIKGVIEVNRILAGEKTPAMTYLDAICSGIQILSVLTRCPSGCKATGAINMDTDIRPNAYLAVQREMESILGESVEVSYKDIKDAVMTSCYGSKKVPKDLFGEGPVLQAFEEACKRVAPGAFNLLPVLRGTWNPETYAHTWTLPDGHVVFTPVMTEEHVKLEIAELGNYKMSTMIYDNQPKLRGLANIANVTHSLDAYILRNVVRYCNYDKQQLEDILYATEKLMCTVRPETSKEYEEVKKLNYLDFHSITTMHLEVQPMEVLMLVKQKVMWALAYEPFEVLTVHDCFVVNATNSRRLKEVYNLIIAEMSESRILDDILSQLYGKPVELQVFPDSIYDDVLNNDYAIC